MSALLLDFGFLLQFPAHHMHELTMNDKRMEQRRDGNIVQRGGAKSDGRGVSLRAGLWWIGVCDKKLHHKLP